MLNRRTLLSTIAAASLLLPAPAQPFPLGWYDPPCDLISGVTCAYGIKALRLAWFSGPCFDLRLDDFPGTTTTINFINGNLDMASLVAFASPNFARVTKWYDQSGNGNHAVQSNPDLQPYVRVANGLVLWSTGALVFDRGDTVSTTVYRSLEIPNGATFSAAASTAFCLCETNNTGLQDTLFELGTDTSNLSYFGALIRGDCQWIFNGTDMLPAETDNLTTVWMVNAGNSSFGGVGSKSVSPSASFAPIGAPAGGTLGWSRATPTRNGYIGEMRAFIAWGAKALTAGQVTTINAALNQRFGVQPRSNDVIIPVGDSWSTQFLFRLGAMQSGWVTQVLPQLKRNVKSFNASFGGSTLAEVNTNYATQIAPVYDGSATTNTCILFRGGNDTGTLQHLLDMTDQFCVSAKATGFKVLIAEEIPWDYPQGQNFCIDSQAKMVSYNSSIRNLTHHDGVVPLTVGTVFANHNVIFDPTYYQADNEHCTITGYAIIAGIMANSVNGLL